MKYILVNMSANYGVDCMGCGHNSENSDLYEVSEEAAATLLEQLEEKDTLSMNDVEDLIMAGCQELKPVHEAILEDIHEMEIEYWLDECKQGADDGGALQESKANDLKSGVFKPSKTLEEFCQEEGIDMQDEDFDPDYCEEYQQFVEDEYWDWVDTLDLYQQAEKFGMDIDAVIDYENTGYTITSVEEEKKVYAIDKDYYFDAEYDGPRPSGAGSVKLHLQLDHDDVMSMGEYFEREDPYSIEYDSDFGLNDQLNEALAASISQDLYEEWQAEQDELDEEEREDTDSCGPEDFVDQAYERMADLYVNWSYELKEDCIQYYQEHKN